jgi:glycosyltransferase involved in cell wall biosynthesis
MVNLSEICIVSTDPANDTGVSTYTNSLVLALRDIGCKIVILCNKNGRPKRLENGIEIEPCWSGLLYPFHIFKSLLRHPRIQLVHIQHEFFLFGGLINALLFPTLLLLIKFLRIPVVVTLHGVIRKQEIDQSFIKENGILGPALIFRLGITVLIRSIVDLSDEVIVITHKHREILVREFGLNQNKIHLVPHGLVRSECVPNEVAKRCLGFEGLTVIFFYGFLSKYKGVEILVSAFKNIAKTRPNTILVLGTGMHPRLRQQKWYRSFYSSLLSEAKRSNGQIRVVGFIPKAEISLYLSSADVVVFPYTSSLATGGPYHNTIGFGRPVLVSNRASFGDELPLEARFNPNSADLERTLIRILDDPLARQKITNSLRTTISNNTWDRIAFLTIKVYELALNRKRNRCKRQ